MVNKNCPDIMARIEFQGQPREGTLIDRYDTY